MEAVPGYIPDTPVWISQTRNTGNIKLHFDLVPLILTALTLSAPSYSNSLIWPEARLLFLTVPLSRADCLASVKVCAQPCLFCWPTHHYKFILLLQQELGARHTALINFSRSTICFSLLDTWLIIQRLKYNSNMNHSGLIPTSSVALL